MTDSDKLKAISDALMGIVNIINKKEEVVVEEKTVEKKKKAGRPKKTKVEPLDESDDVHTIIKNPNGKVDQKGSLIQMEIRTSPMSFVDDGPPLDKIDKKLSYIKAKRTARKQKPYNLTLIDCTCDKCGKTYKVDKIFAPKKFDSEDDGGRYLCDKCIKKKGY